MVTKPSALWNGAERRELEPIGWHLDKKVPITLILVLLMQGVAGIWAVAEIKKDVELLKADNLVLHAADTRLSVDAKEDRAIIREQLHEITRKVDRLIERVK